ncbi:heme-copper oxidase family protein [Swingsia samuiensis]|uniref:Cytochrome oxidase subunit I profile domain-containing protein n=1 Tax=Swingsia samuiensis TaxID=1293412 RepID=A0A4Y6UME0_9PROT|nr:hypothetical protein [Swingsia samuiensis]QDH17561.1 hypothetical protein E3D00_08300 [Swingsia samuiensis]
MINQAFTTRNVIPARRIGVSFILLALFAGLLGGALAFLKLPTESTAGQVFCHGILMTFYVMCPAVLGGFWNFFLSDELKVKHSTLPVATVAGLCFLSAGIVLLPLQPVLGVLCWSVGILCVALDVITTFLEGRSVSFKNISPFAWSVLATASGAIIIASALAALVTRLVVDESSVSKVYTLAHILYLPEQALMITPALGLVCHVLLAKTNKTSALSFRIASYIFGIIAVIGPLCWLDSLFGAFPLVLEKYLFLLTQLIPVSFLVLAVCWDAWNTRRELTGVTLWAVASLILFGISWVTEFLYSGSFVEHTAASFGGVMALCCGLYAWIQKLYPSGFPSTLCRIHAGLTFFGALCSLLPSLMIMGEGMMGVSLLTFGLLGLSLVKAAEQSRVRI